MRADYESTTKQGYLQGVFEDNVTAKKMAALRSHLSDLCQVYASALFKKLPANVQQMIVEEQVEFRVIWFGPVVEVRWFSEDEAVRSHLDMFAGLYQLLLWQVLRSLGNDVAVRFRSVVYDDLESFRTTNLTEFASLKP